MPFSLLISGYPTSDLPAGQAQGPAVQGMFFNLLEAVDPSVVQRLHNDQKYRPYTLSPLGVGEPGQDFRGFRLPRRHLIQKENVEKRCACCGRLVKIRPEYAYCNSCMEHLERYGDWPY